MEKYKDIIYMKYTKSGARSQMSMHERAAQFSSFAALSGYEEAIEEEARLTDARILLGEDEKKEIGDQLRTLKDNIARMPRVKVVFFVMDERKSGGRYVTIEGKVKRVREYEQELVMENGETIAFQDLLYIQGEIFE